MSSDRQQVDFYFDIMCPWAYQSSIWIREVRTQNNLEISWKFFSLEEINRIEGKKHPWEREWSYGWSMLRISAMLRRQSMEDVDRYYEAAGRALHEEGRKPHSPEGSKEILADIGLDPDIVDMAIADPTTNDEVLADHNTVVDLGGFGVPILVFPNGTTIFGPVVTPGPIEKAAMRLWDLTVGWQEFPHLYEMRRPKTEADKAHIEAQFRPYVEARDWRTISNPAP